MSKRLETLEKMVTGGQADSFARYALAMEYRRENRIDDALEAFTALRSDDPDYLPMYLMAGQMLADLDRPDEARPWLIDGLALAEKQSDTKARSELQAALDDL